MPGIATQFVVLENTIERLASSGDPALIAAATVMKDNPAYAHLGAIGPALVDFLPADPPVGAGPSVPQSAFATLWTQVLAIAGGDGTAADPGVLHVVSEFRRLLGLLDTIAAAEDVGALKDLRDSGEVAVVETLADQLKTIVDGLLPRVAAIGSSITTGMRPATTVPPGATVPPAAAWSARDWLHTKHPGRFAQALAADAVASGDPRFLAYAYGYLSSFAGAVGIAPFINSIVGASYRQQWWRTRWVSNYVDVWTHGFAHSAATMTGDVPTPPYPQWAPLCDAKLHERIALGTLDPVALMTGLRTGQAFPTVLPGDFADYWMGAWTKAYGPPSPTGRFRAPALNGAYLMTYLQLWFQTSGEVIGCAPPTHGGPPATCGSAPSWVDPNVPGDNGSPEGPAVPEPESDPDVGEIITGAILAILGGAAILFGATAAGAAAIAVGVGLIIDGATQLDWAKLRCDLYWLRQYLENGLRALHDLLTLGGFSHPYPHELALDHATVTLLGVPYTFDSGNRVTKSRPLFPRKLTNAVGRDSMGPFPTKPWDGGLGEWVKTPDAAHPGVEEPETTGYLRAEYPSFAVLDAAANPLTPDSDVRTGTSWPPGERRLPGSEVPVTFANAADNAADLIRTAGADLPDWNLDADRGMAWLTWQFPGSLVSDPISVEAES